MAKIPNDLILFISGVSCVGKTAVAQNLVKVCPEFRNISEMDIIRTVARKIVRDFAFTNNLSINTICDNEVYASLFESTKKNDFKTYKKQASFFVSCIDEIVKRQQSRKIPTIIEGINIVPSLFFNNSKLINGFETDVIFFNLYLSDYKVHVQRRFQRCQERGYPDNYAEAETTVNQIIRNKQNELLYETAMLARRVNNVFNIDTSNKTVEEVSKVILDRIYQLFPS